MELSGRALVGRTIGVKSTYCTEAGKGSRGHTEAGVVGVHRRGDGAHRDRVRVTQRQG